MKNNILKYSILSISLAAFVTASLAKERELAFGLLANTVSPEYLAAEKMAETVSELSDGQLTIKLYPDGQLGDHQSLLDQTSLGELDMTYADSQAFPTYEKMAAPLGQAYVIKSHEHALAIYNSEWGKELKEALRNNHSWEIININYQGTRHTTSNKPINSLEDFKGLQIRVPNAKPMVNWAKAMGATPTPIPFTEVYLALQTNAVDGQENPLTLIDAKKFYEVQKNIALTGHMVQDQILLMNSDVWASLSDEEKDMIFKASEEGRKLQYDLVTKGEAELIDFFKEQGLTITELDTAELESAMEPIWEEYDLETINMLRDIK